MSCCRTFRPGGGAAYKRGRRLAARLTRRGSGAGNVLLSSYVRVIPPRRDLHGPRAAGRAVGLAPQFLTKKLTRVPNFLALLVHSEGPDIFFPEYLPPVPFHNAEKCERDRITPSTAPANRGRRTGYDSRWLSYRARQEPRRRGARPDPARDLADPANRLPYDSGD